MLLILAGCVGSAMARPAPPEPCPAARYLVVGDPIAGTAAGMQYGPSTSFDGLCDPVAPKRLKANHKGVTILQARWPHCNGLNGTVVLHAKIMPGCNELDGMLKAKKFKRKFQAMLSRCGDGVLDPRNGEDCDDGNAVAGDGCEPDCKKTAPIVLPTTTTFTTTTTSSTAAPTTTTSMPPSTTTTTTFGSSTTTTSTVSVTTTTTTTHATSTTTTSTTTIPGTTTTTTMPKTVLALVMIADPDPVAPAGLVTYELTATNRGPADAVQAVLHMTLPNGLYDCGTPSDGGQLPTGCAATKDVVWALGTIPVGASRTVRMFVQILGTVTSGTNIVAMARLDDAAFSPEASAQATVVAQSANPLTLTLTEDADPVQVGDDLEYVLRFGNDSATALLNTQLALTLPGGTTVLDAGGGTSASGMVTWSLGALNAGQAGERRVRVHIETLAPNDPLVRVARAAITSGTVAARASVVAQLGTAALGLVLVAEPDPVVPAGLLTYRLTATNHGATESDQVQLRLSLPVGVFACAPASDGGTTPQGCSADADVLWTFDTLPAGTSRTEQLTIQILGSLPAGATLLAAARVEDASGARARAGIGTTVQTAPPLDLVLTTDADPVQVGDDLEYVLRFGNGSATALLSTQLALVLPAGETVVDAGGGTQASDMITWSLGALNAGQADERRVRVHIDDLSPADPLVRVAHAAITSGATAARASVVTQIEATPLGVELVAEPDPVAPAGLILYRVTAANHGMDDAVQTELLLTLPVGVFACAVPSDGGTLPDGCVAGRDVVWALDTLAAGETRSVQLAIQIRGDIPTGTVLSTSARIDDVAGARARTATGTTVQTGAPLDLVLTTDADPVQVGDTLEYALRFGNSGAASLLGTQLAFTVPAGTTVVDAGGGTAAAGTITWALGSLDPTVTGERRVRVHVDSLAAEPLVRVARGTVTSGTAAARAGVVTQVQTTPLGIELVAEPDPVAPAGLILYQVTAANHGVDDSVQAELRLTLPVGVFACAVPSDGGTTPDGCVADRDVVWALGTLTAGETRSVQLGIQIRGDTPSGAILSTSARIEDVAGSRSRTAISTAAETTRPLGLVLTTDADPVQAGDTLTYALRFGNSGAASLLSTQLVLTLPPGTAVVDAGGGTASGDTVTWSLGTLAAAATGEKMVQVHVDALSPDPLVRVARAAITSGTATARAGVVTQLQAPVFGLAIGATPDPVAPAGMLTYQLTVKNDGGTDAVQVALRITLPVGVFACGTISDSGATPDGCVADRDVLWNLGTMSAGAMRTVSAVIQVRGDIPSGSILSTGARVEDVAGSRTRAGVTTAVVK
jgi:uncharacterized repeat protein (TIGR01451 family)